MKFGDNVYYFPYVSDEFGKALQKFLDVKLDVLHVSISGDVAKAIPDSHGQSFTHAGYWVVCTLKPKGTP